MASDDYMSVDESSSSACSEDLNAVDFGDLLGKLVKECELSKSKGRDEFEQHRQRILDFVQRMREKGELVLMRKAIKYLWNETPIPKDVWLNYLKDEIRMCSGIEVIDDKELLDMFERAFMDCGEASVDLWLLRLEFQKLKPDKIEELIETALGLCGQHVQRGDEIWEFYRSYKKSIESRVEVIKAIYEREFNCNLSATHERFDEYVALFDSDELEHSEDLKRARQLQIRSQKRLESRLVYEMMISQSETKDIVSAFCSYIDFELKNEYELALAKNEQNPRVLSLFERSLEVCRTSSELWHRYIRYLIGKSSDTVKRKCEIAVRFCEGESARIWIEYANHEERTQGTVVDVYNRAINANFQSNGDYKMIWTAFLSYLRRHTNFEDEQAIDLLRSYFQRAINELYESFGTEADSSFFIERYWAHVEAKFCHRMDLARKIWRDSILIPGTPHERQISYWLEYIQLEKCFGGNDKHIRKAYQRALARCSGRERIIKEFVRFEQQNGTLKTYDEAINLIEFVGDVKSVKQTISKEDETRKRQFSSNVQIENRRKRIDISTTKKTYVPPPKPDPERTVFLSNIPFDCNEDQVEKALCNILTDHPVAVKLAQTSYGGNQRKARGFGHALFATKEAANAALAFDNTTTASHCIFRLENAGNVQIPFSFFKGRSPSGVDKRSKQWQN
ncbi:hypothetical protein ACOME3_005574 [Neoechinorhynchus agilis]